MRSGSPDRIVRHAVVVLLAAGSVWLAPVRAQRAPVGAPAPGGDAVALEVVDHLGGTVGALALAGEVAFAGIGPRVVALSAEGDRLERLGQSALLTGNVLDLAPTGPHIVAITSRDTLEVVDVSDPTVGHILGVVGLSGPPQDLTVAGDHAFVLGTKRGGGRDDGLLLTVDLSDPAKPLEVGRLVVGETLALATSHGVAAVLERRLSSATSLDRHLWLRLIDASDPRRPRTVSELDLGEIVQSGADAAIDGHFLYVTMSEYPGFQTIDISDLAQPRVVAMENKAGGSRVLLVGRYAYMTERWPDSEGPLHYIVVDIHDPLHPTHVGYFTGLELPPGTSINDRLVVSSAASEGRVWTARGDTIALTRLGGPAERTGWHAWTLFSAARDIAEDAVHPGRLYSVRHFADVTAVDARNDAALALDGTLALQDYWRSTTVATGKAPNGDGLLFVADGHGQDARFAVVDARDPAAPVLLNTMTVPDFIQDTAASASLAVLAVNHSEIALGPPFATTRTLGVRIVDARDPGAPRLAGSVWLPPITVRQSSARSAIVARGTIAYLGTPTGLVVVDFSHMDAPAIVGRTDMPQAITHLAVHGNRLLVSGDDIVLFDVTDPATPRAVGHLDLSTSAPVALDDVFAYVAAGPSLRAYRLEAPWPAAPATELPLAEPPEAILRNASTGLLVVADGVGGLVTLRLRPVSPWRLWLPRLDVPASK